jgi:sugar phosphate isomerase/epimerase
MSKSLRRCEVIELSNSLNCNIVVLNPNEVSAVDQVSLQIRFDEFMIETAKVAEAYDVHVGFEYVSWDNTIINSLAQIQAFCQ